MKDFFNKFKIPTLLGLTIIFIGLAGGIYLVIRQQSLISQTIPDLTPQNITFSNITDDSITISWKTNIATTAFISYGQNSPNEQNTLDDQDSKSPTPHIIHHVTIKNLLPKTNYQFKIISNKLTSEAQKFNTASPLTTQPEFTPIIGSITDNDLPLADGIAYLIIDGATTQSSLIKAGNFLIPISQIRKADLTDTYKLTENEVAKLTIISDKGESGALFKLRSNSSPLPPLKLGQNIDLTNLPESTPQPTPNTQDLTKYDLNGDGKINVADYAIISTCLNKKPITTISGGKSCTKADINSDGIINQIDLDLMSQRLEELGS